MYRWFSFLILAGLCVSATESQAAKNFPRYEFLTQEVSPDSLEAGFCLEQCDLAQDSCESSAQESIDYCVGRATEEADERYEALLEDYEERLAEHMEKEEACNDQDSSAMVTLAGCLDIISRRPFQTFSRVSLFDQEVKARGCYNQNLCSIERSNCDQQCGKKSLTTINCVKNCSKRDGPKKVRGRFAPRTNVPEGMTLVYFYRPAQGGYRAYKAYISANREEIVALRSGQFYEYILPAGAVSFQTRFAKNITSIDDVVLTEGATYYLRSFLDSGFFAKDVVSALMPIPEAVATAEMYGMKGKRSALPIMKAAADPTAGLVASGGKVVPVCSDDEQPKVLAGCISGVSFVTGAYRQAYQTLSGWSGQASGQVSPILEKEQVLQTSIKSLQEQIQLLQTDKRRNRKEIRKQKKEEKALQKDLKKLLTRKRSVCRALMADTQSMISDHDRLISSALKRARSAFKAEDRQVSVSAGTSLACAQTENPVLLDCAQALEGVNISYMKAHDSMLSWSVNASTAVEAGGARLASLREDSAATNAEIIRLTELDKRAHRKQIRKLKRVLKASQKAERTAKKLNSTTCSQYSSGVAEKVSDLGDDIDLSFKQARDSTK